MKERAIWALLGLLVLVGVVGGWATSRTRTIHPRLARELPEPRPQAATGRSLRPSLGEPLAVIATGPERGLTAPGRLRIVPDGSVVVVDYDDMRLERVSTGGGSDNIGEIEPYGEAPLGLANPMDLVPVPDGRLWIADPKAGGLLLVAPDGTPVRTVVPDHPIMRLAVSPSGRLFALTPTADGHLFEAYDAPGASPSATFGALIEPPDQMPYTTDGSIAATSSGGLVYAPRYVGVLARYDADGSLRYLVQTLEPVAPPTLVREDGRLRGDPEARVASQALEVAGDAVLVVHPGMTTDSGETPSAYLDLYSLEDGTYRASWALERRWSELRVAGDRLYALTARGIEIFRTPLLRVEPGEDTTASPSIREPAARGGCPLPSARGERDQEFRGVIR